MHQGIFVGYDKGSPAYLVYYPETGKVMKHRVVKFNTNRANEQQTQTDGQVDDDDDFLSVQRNSGGQVVDTGISPGISDQPRIESRPGPRSQTNTSSVSTD